MKVKDQECIHVQYSTEYCWVPTMVSIGLFKNPAGGWVDTIEIHSFISRTNPPRIHSFIPGLTLRGRGQTTTQETHSR